MGTDTVIQICVMLGACIALAGFLTRRHVPVDEITRLCPPGYEWVEERQGYANKYGHFVSFATAADLHSRGVY